VKIEFDEATIEAAVNARIEAEAYGDGAAKFFARFYADAANRQLEAMEKPVFEVGKTYLNGEGRKWKILSYCADEPGYDMAVLSDKGIKCSFMANGQRWKVGPIKYYDLLPGAIEESGQAGVSPPLVEGGSPAPTDEELGRELLASIGMIPAQVLQQELAALGRRARELLTPQFAEQIADATRRLGDDVAHCKERARKAEQVLNSLRREGEHHMRSVDESDDPYDKGLRQGMLIALYAAGFTIVPAQPLKVIRHD